MTAVLERPEASDLAFASARIASASSTRGAGGASVWANRSPRGAYPTAPTYRAMRVHISGQSLPTEVIVEDGLLTVSEIAPQSLSAVDAAQWMRDALGLSMSQLASLADVTRAAAYAWFKGTTPHAGKAANLLAIQAALKDLDALDLRYLQQVWGYPDSTGQSLFKLLQSLTGLEGEGERVARALEAVDPKLKQLTRGAGSTQPANEFGSAHFASTQRHIGPFGS